MRFDLTDLRLFLLVTESSNITKGAERAGLALASASARIRAMEEELGVPLLERGRRGVQTTPAGQALAFHARTVVEQMERMRGELGAYAQGLKGHVRLWANSAAMAEFLPDPLAAFLAANPHIDIDLEEKPSPRTIEGVAEGLTDIGIVMNGVEFGDLETRPFRVDRLVVVAPHDHPVAAFRQVAFREIVDAEFVGLGQNSALQEHLRRHAARMGKTLKLRVRMGSFDAVCRLVAQGVSLGVVPEMAAHRCAASMPIRVIPLTDAWALRHLTICLRRLDLLSLQARMLVEALGPHQP
jgi:DNA-binding transcriptional LysR family regulator